MERMTLAVADLIPGDVLIPEGWVVDWYPHGIKGLPGTLVPFDKSDNSIPFRMSHYYGNPEHTVDILREV